MFLGLKGTIRDIFVFERERNNKEELSLFQVQIVKNDNFGSRLVFWTCKEPCFASL
jgi:hypothetical protein